MPLDAVWLGKTLQQRVGLSSPMCPECLGTNAPLHSPLESIQGSDRCLFIKEEKKKMWFDISGERTSHVKHVKQTAVFHQYSWKHSAAGGWRHRGIWQAFCLFQSACSVCVCPTRLSPCAVSTCICSRRCAQLHLITHALSQLQALASNDLRYPSRGVLKLLLFSRQHLTFAENCPLLKCLSLDSPK